MQYQLANDGAVKAMNPKVKQKGAAPVDAKADPYSAPGWEKGLRGEAAASPKKKRASTEK